MKRLLPLGLCLTLLGGCAHDGLQIDRSHPSQNQNSRVQYIVLHYTSTNLANSLHLLTEGDVSAHYLIGAQPPTVYQLVSEDRRAWHAGQSEWQGRTWLNASTIGIELVNEGYRQTGHGLEWEPFDEGQINALIPLLKDLVKRHGLPLFPWKRLADAGLVPWPDDRAVAEEQVRFATALPTVDWFQMQLERQGYAVPRNGQLDEATRNVIAAFQMKYRPSRYDGQPDAETAALLLVLNRGAR